MKLLLTSSGITNPSITQALFELVGKRLEDTSIVVIPTASNLEIGDKGWLIEDLVNLRHLNFKSIDIADISAVEESIWRAKLEAADILFFEGGNTYHLMKWVNKSGLVKLLPDFLKTKVYVGVSAGSMITNPSLSLKISQVVYEEDLDQNEDMAGLGFVDFYVLPHLNSLDFKKIRKNYIEEAIQEMSKKIYALDDNSALKVVDGIVEVISEGEWFELN